jgi:hypothetical protein
MWPNCEKKTRIHNLAKEKCYQLYFDIYILDRSTRSNLLRRLLTGARLGHLMVMVTVGRLLGWPKEAEEMPPIGLQILSRLQNPCSGSSARLPKLRLQPCQVAHPLDWCWRGHNLRNVLITRTGMTLKLMKMRAAKAHLNTHSLANHPVSTLAALEAPAPTGPLDDGCRRQAPISKTDGTRSCRLMSRTVTRAFFV